MCLGPPPIPPTQKAALYQKIILIIMLVLIGIVILDFIALQFVPAFFGIMLLLVLFLARRQMGHQLLMIFIFFSIYFAILFLVQFLTPIQNQKNINSYSSKDKFNYAVYCISFVFYVFCAIFLFFPYRQFKAITFSQNPALAAYFNNPGTQQEMKNQRKKPQNQQQAPNYNVDYGDFNYQQKKQNNNKGEFQVFKGEGVRIG